jgi:ArsR family transcriptional regulator, arsenate/arsenite/antimonite-responsive transcriptional repressor
METKRLARILKALSHPNRLEIFLSLMQNHEARFEAPGFCDCFISDIARKMNIGAPTISHHLKELADADLIITDRHGKHVVARVNEDSLNAVNAVLSLPQTPASKPE